MYVAEIKTHGSESLTQEEAACMCTPPSLRTYMTTKVNYLHMYNRALKFINTASEQL